jgi:hypothetical protein
VPASDRPASLGAALAAVEAAAGIDDEIVVVTEGDGPAAARNAGAQLARGEVVVFVDSDVEVHPDALDRIRAAFAADPELTAVFGSYDDDPSADGTVSRFRNLLHHHVHQSSAGDAVTFWAGLGAVRRDAFMAAGGFDAESYRAAMMEDIELGMRLADGGARIRLDPALRGRHLKRWTLGSMVHTDLARRGIPWVRMLIGRRQAPSSLNLSWRHRVTALLYAGATAALVAQLVVATAVLLTAAALLIGSAVAINRGFHGLLLNRGGPLLALAGVPLHWVHHLIAVAALPLGAASHLVLAARGARAPSISRGLPALEDEAPVPVARPHPAAGAVR